MIFIFAAGGRNYYITGLILFGLLVVFAARRYASEKKGGRDYFHGGKDSSFLSTAGKLFATVAGVVSFLSAVRLGFTGGYAGCLCFFAAAITLFFLAYCFCGAREKGYTSVPAELSREFGAPKAFEVLISLVLVAAQLLLAGRIAAVGLELLSYFTSVHPALLYVAVILLSAVHTVLGGYAAVEHAGCIRFWVIAVGAGVLLYRALSAAGGFIAIQETFIMLERGKELSFLGYKSLGPAKFLSLFLLTFCMVLTLPIFRGGIYTAQNKPTARSGFFFSGLLVLIFSPVPALIGMSSAVLAQNDRAVNILSRPESAFAFIADSSGGPLLCFLFLLAGLLSAVSAVDACMISSADMLANNIISNIKKSHTAPKNYTRLSRAMAALAAIFALTLSYFSSGVFDDIIEILVPVLCALVLFGRFSKGPKWGCALIALLAGVLLGVLLVFFPGAAPEFFLFENGPVVPVFLTALLFCLVLSKCVQLYRKRIFFRKKRQ